MNIKEFENQIIQGNVLEVLKTLPEKSINMCMTSPPYWALRNYSSETEVIWDGKEDCEHEWEENIQAARGGYSEDSIVGSNAAVENKRHPIKSNFCKLCGAWKGQLGLESDFNLYISHLADIFDEVKRVLRDDGTIWVVIGDTYARGGNPDERFDKKSYGGKATQQDTTKLGRGITDELQSKCLALIPFRFAIEMINRGWILRNTIIWYKPNTMPSCLDPKTKVFVKRDKIKQIEIKDIKLGDLILSPTGWKKVKKKWITKQESLLFQYGTTGNVLCGKNHKFPISHDNRRKNYSIEKISKVKENNQRTQRLLFKPIKDFLNKDLIEEDYEIGKFVGLIVAEGGFNSVRGNQGKITLHKNEKKLMNWFISVLKKRFNQKTIYHKFVDNYQYCQFSSKIVKDLLKTICEGSCKGKKLNRDKILNSSYSFRKGLFDGIILGDGHINKKGRITYGTASNQLRDDMGLLASSIGLLYSIHESHRRDKRTNKIYDGFYLTIPLSLQKEFIKGETIKSNYPNRNLKKQIPREYKNVFSTKTIKFIKKDERKEKGEMIDIEVEDGLFLIENGLVSHNSVKDRFTVNFEYLFFFSKKRKYYFETQYEDTKAKVIEPRMLEEKREVYFAKHKDGQGVKRTMERNKRTVWTITTQPFGEAVCMNCGHFSKPKSIEEKKGYFGGEDKSERVCEKCGSKLTTSHFAIYPRELCETPIKAGCPEFVCKKCGNPKIKDIEYEFKGATKSIYDDELKGYGQSGLIWDRPAKQIFKGYKPTCNCNAGFSGGIILDPFFGAGTTGLVALKQNKIFLGIELNKTYIKIAEKRLSKWLKQTKLF